MLNRGNRLKFTVVLAMTALALTGFVPARSGHGSRGHSGSYSRSHSSGGGCSSSHQDHDGSSSSHDYDGSSSTSGSSYGGSGSTYGKGDTYGSSGSTGGSSYTRRPSTRRPTATASPTGRGLQDGTVRLVSCASTAKPYATVEVDNRNGRSARFLVSVTFVDSSDITITEKTVEVKVSARDEKTAKVNIGGEGLADSVDHCEVDPRASVESA